MEELIEELTKVSPEQLSKEGLKLFEKINEIIDRNKELESALDNSVSKDEIRKLKGALEIEQAYDFIDNRKAIETLQELLNKGE